MNNKIKADKRLLKLFGIYILVCILVVAYTTGASLVQLFFLKEDGWTGGFLPGVIYEYNYLMYLLGMVIFGLCTYITYKKIMFKNYRYIICYRLPFRVLHFILAAIKDFAVFMAIIIVFLMCTGLFSDLKPNLLAFITVLGWPFALAICDIVVVVKNELETRTKKSSDMMNTDMVNMALNFAYKKHNEQSDKSGVPYIFHPYSVALKMKTEDTVVAALLHDVVEDTDTTLEELTELGFADKVVEAVGLLTHKPEISYGDYVVQISKNPIAHAVKIGDLEHNLDGRRMKEIPEKMSIKREHAYKPALAFLLTGDDKLIEYIDY